MPSPLDRTFAATHEIARIRALVEDGRSAVEAMLPNAGLEDGPNAPAGTKASISVGNLRRAATAMEQGLSLLSLARARLAVDEAAVREVEHRIVDGLQIASLMLLRQANHTDEHPTREALHAAAARVDAISHLHAALCTTRAEHGVSTSLDAGSYLTSLCATLGAGRDDASRHARVQVNAESWTAPPVVVQRLGFIATELVGNALRHAHPSGRAGTIRVDGQRQADGGYRLSVEDDGVGLPRGFDLRLRRSGFGLRMVLLLTDHLRARVTADTVVGARFTLVLPPRSALPA